MLPARTNLLFLRRSLGEAVADDYVAWALERLTAGADTPSLRILAGLNTRLESDDVEPYFRKTCDELALAPPPVETSVREAVSLVRAAYESSELSPRETLEVVADIYHWDCRENAALRFLASMSAELPLAGSGGDGSCYPPTALNPLDAAVKREWALYDRYISLELPPAFDVFVMCEACHHVGEVSWRNNPLWKQLVTRVPGAQACCAVCGATRFRHMSDPAVREEYFTRLEAARATERG
ncbi:MAG TPA: hypothetical protein VFQ35_01220 [Polyangiaceae bacterium]|nr:hypothetical protein [Polyangiaceae bacterium]